VAFPEFLGIALRQNSIPMIDVLVQPCGFKAFGIDFAARTDDARWIIASLR